MGNDLSFKHKANLRSPVVTVSEPEGVPSVALATEFDQKEWTTKRPFCLMQSYLLGRLTPQTIYVEERNLF